MKVTVEVTQIVNTQRPDLPFSVLVTYKDDGFESESGVCVASREASIAKAQELTGEMLARITRLGRDNA